MTERFGGRYHCIWMQGILAATIEEFNEAAVAASGATRNQVSGHNEFLLHKASCFLRFQQILKCAALMLNGSGYLFLKENVQIF